MANSTGIFSLLRRPAGWLPLAMSMGALTVVLGHLAVFGSASEADEGAAAHIWQFLLLTQLPLVALFAIKWLPRAPRQAFLILLFQVCAALLALAPVWLFKL